MKDRVGYFQLHIFNDNESEKHIYQNGRPTDFELNNKVKNGAWQRVYKPKASTIRWYAEPNSWGEPINLSSLVTIEEAAIRPRSRTSDPLPVSVSGEWTWEDPFVDTETLQVTLVNAAGRSVTMESTSGVALREMHRREQLAQRFPSDADHVRSHREVMNAQALAASMQLHHENEMARRAAQREAEHRRQEEERNRQRRPWERVRNFFGRD